jgi:hypothetical protein
MSARVLFLDDSGKPDAAHASEAVVIAGFAVDATVYPLLSRRILGAKKKYFPSRGVPAAWEIKSTAIIKPNPWKRAKNRAFCDEVARLLRTTGATCFAVTLDKAKMHHPMTLATSMPLQLQALVEHFDVECKAQGSIGMIVADWSAHHHDQHASRCVASFVGSRGLKIHPGVYYASSHGSEGIQVCDLLAGVRRRAAEGDAHLAKLDAELASIRLPGKTGTTVKGRAFANYINMF